MQIKITYGSQRSTKREQAFDTDEIFLFTDDVNVYCGNIFSDSY